jgi:hypothetical protein
MPEEDAGAGEMQQAEEVVDVPLPASHKPPEVVEPGKKPFDLPAATRTTDTPPIRVIVRRPPRCAAIISIP